MTELTLVLIMLTGLLALLDWRKGLAMCVVMGVAQDPLRKLAPGQPVYYVVLVCVIFSLAWLRAALLKVPLGPSAIQGWKQKLATPFGLFIFLVLAQAMHSFVAYRSFMMTAIGLLVWLAPVPAVIFAYQFAVRRGVQGMRAWMTFYIACAMVAMTGVYLEYSGFDWRTLGEIGEGQIIYDVGTVLKAHSGFFRASEIAAWHAAAMACFLFVLSIGKRVTPSRIVLGLAFISILVGLGILTGRRKMLVEISAFLSTYFFFVTWLQKGMGRLAAVVLIMGFVGYVGIVGFVAPDLVQGSYSKHVGIGEGERLQGYVIRGQSVFADIPARVNGLGLQPILWSLDSYGWLGAGLGTGSQGAAYDIALQFGLNRGAAEGGLGKITMELGLPGLFIVGWLLLALGKHMKSQLVPLASTSPHHARIAFGLVAFLVANFATFSLATQAYSDPFALLILGWSLGFCLAMPAVAAKESQGAKRTAQWRADARAGGPGWSVPTRPMAVPGMRRR